MILKFVRHVAKTVTLEGLIRLSARLSADILFYSMTKLRDPRVSVGITVATTVIRQAEVISKNHKRTNFESTVIFEESIDAIRDAF